MGMTKKIGQFLTKLNPAQEDISLEQGGHLGANTAAYNHRLAYDRFDVVRRGTDLIVDSASEIQIDIGDKLDIQTPTSMIRAKKIDTLLNKCPNPFVSVSEYRRNILIDLIMEGNAFIYFDGAHLFNLPASQVTIETSETTFIKKYVYSTRDFKPSEIIHIRDNSSSSIFRGDSRLLAASHSLASLDVMMKYQSDFFTNGAVPGLVLMTDNVLSKKVKERTIAQWSQSYNLKGGGRRPAIADGGMKIDTLNSADFRELAFSESVKIHEDNILKALGVPPLLLNSGNNANITPNLKMFYVNTVLPLLGKTLSSYERFFGYDLKPNKQDIEALRPELRELANFYGTLVNAGIMKRNEAREKLRLEKVDTEEANALIIPANVAGSAVSSTDGGRPDDNTEEP